MLEFITKWFKPEIIEKVKKEYKSVPMPKARKPKANWIIARDEDIKECEDLFKAQEIINGIINLCNTAIRPDQEDCPTLIIYEYKRLIELGYNEALDRTTDMLRIYLSETQHQDFMNKVCQLKEYKEWKLNNKLNEIKGDFE